MQRTMIAIAAAAALVLAVILAPSIKRQLDGTTDTYQAQQRLELRQAEYTAQLDNQHAAATAPGRVALTYAAIIAAIVLMGVVIWTGQDAYQQRRTPLVHADSYGRLPVSRRTVTDPQRAEQMLMATMATIQQAAQIMIAQAEAQARLAERLTITMRESQARQLPPPADERQAPSTPASTPSFSDLLRAGQINAGKGLILGYENGEPVSGTWKDLYSTALAGLSGTGKTTTQRFLAGQTALKGARFVVIDPHRDAEPDEDGEYQQLSKALEPLDYAFLCAPAATDAEILESVRFLADIGKRRVTGKESVAYPVIAWLDETTSLLSRSSVADELATLLERIAQEYRKVGVFASLSGQIWKATHAGGTALRDSLASVICHRMKPGQARLLLTSEDANRAARLDIGQAVLWRTTGQSQVITIPNTTAADLAMLAAPRKHPGSHMEAPAEAPNTAAERPKLQSPDEERVISAFVAGRDVSDIAKERAEGKSSGRKYSDELAQVNRVIRRHAAPKTGEAHAT